MEWYNTSWNNRLQVTCDSDLIGSDETDYPLYIDLGDLGSDFFDNVQADGDDIRITEDDGVTEQPFELVDIDTVLEEGELHTKCATFTGNTDPVVCVYFNNPDASGYAEDDEFGAQAVWTDYEFVWHGNNYNDSSPNQYDLSNYPNAPAQDTGKIGSAYDFDKDNTEALGNATVPNLRIDGDQTWSCWFKPHIVNLNAHRIVAISTATPSQYFSLNLSNTSWITAISSGPGNCYDNAPNPEIDNWYYYYTAFETGVGVDVAINGTNNRTASATAHTAGTTSTFAIGRLGAYAQYAEGTIDEVRIRADFKDSNWGLTEFNNQNSPSTFYSVGDLESQSGEARTPLLTVLGAG